MEGYNTVHPHTRLGDRSPRECILLNPLHIQFNEVNSVCRQWETVLCAVALGGAKSWFDIVQPA
jgi:hypothetical protein